MTRLLKMLATALAAMTIFVASPAAAQSNSFFDDSAKVSESVLGDISGGNSWALTGRTMKQIAGAEDAEFSQWVGGNARVQMDVWWGSTGSQLIAESVRSALPD